ncbi:hypothetical protein D7Y27_42605, partial [Corallococcus sp. AB004]
MQSVNLQKVGGYGAAGRKRQGDPHGKDGPRALECPPRAPPPPPGPPAGGQPLPGWHGRFRVLGLLPPPRRGSVPARANLWR